MMLFWIAGILLAITLSGSAFFFALHIGTNETVPLARAKALWRWSLVVVLGSFDVWIFARIVAGIRALM